PGAAELLDSLRSRYRIAALSNSNELHWDRNTNEMGITSLFEIAISSHEVGVCKPDPEIYLTALERLRVPPQAVMFFDDVDANVAAASDLGMRAFQVDGVEGVRERLVKEGIEAEIHIDPYNSAWPGMFREERDKLQSILSPWLAGGIEHVGST